MAIDKKGKRRVLTDEITSAATGSSSSTYTIEMDESGSYTYIGKAAVGTATSSAAWQIQRIDESGDPELKIKFADGDDSFNNVFDNRASLSYS